MSNRPQVKICHIRAMEFHNLKLWVTFGMALGFVTGVYFEWTLVSNTCGLLTNAIWLYGREMS